MEQGRSLCLLPTLYLCHCQGPRDLISDRGQGDLGTAGRHNAPAQLERQLQKTDHGPSDP